VNRRGLLALVGLLAGCGGAPTGTESGEGGDGGDTSESVSTRRPSATLDAPPTDATFGYTHHRADGNRLVDGSGAVRERDPVDVAVDGRPVWVVGVETSANTAPGTHWAVVLDDGGVVGLRSDVDGVEQVDVPSGSRAGPPLLVGGSTPALAPSVGAASTHPVPIPGGWAVVRADGTLALRGETTADLDVDAIPDARLVRAGGELFALTDATTDYGHAVLGDGVEAGSVAVVDLGSGAVTARLTAPTGSVVEGIAPIVADVDGDGEREVVVTVSDAERGARIVVFDDGETVSGPPVGTGFRWRHQLAVAPFGPGGETEIAAVKTPHIGGTAEFYRVDGEGVRLVAERGGYSSHDVGSRNLDMALAGRFDGQGSRVGLLVPDDTKRELAFLQRVGEREVEERWRVPVGGTLSSNLAAVAESDGAVTLAAGRDGTVRFWLAP
jgi:hypothetical protein